MNYSPLGGGSRKLKKKIRDALKQKDRGGIPLWAWCVTWGIMLAALIKSFL